MDGRFAPAKTGVPQSGRPSEKAPQGRILVAGAGTPRGASRDAAAPAEGTLVEPTLARMSVHGRPARLLGDSGVRPSWGGGAGGSNASEVTRSSRPCATTPHAPDQDGRCRRRYRRRWIVERTIGWLGTFCRLTVRYDRLLATYGGSTRQTRHVVCPACQTPLDGKPLSEDLLKATVMGSPDGSGGRSVESRHGADHISHATCFGVPAPPLS